MDPKTRQKTPRLLSNGVYIITSLDGDRFGAATVAWISQASFKPPLIMAAIRVISNVFQCLSRRNVAVIHIVDFDQQAVAQRFFTRTRAEFDGINGEPFQKGKNFGSCAVKSRCLRGMPRAADYRGRG
jgi:flavin reductase (DIM6/NTAB) family NADH-FMN oxidoreductase RutF